MVIPSRLGRYGAVLLAIILAQLCLAGTAATLELRYYLPDPIPTGEDVSGYLEIDGHLATMPQVGVAEDDRITLHLRPQQIQRYRDNLGEWVYRIPLRIRIEQAVEDHPLPTVSVETDDGRLARTPRQTISALDPLTQPRQGVQVRLTPSRIVPGQQATLTLRFLAPYRDGWELDPDWQMPLPQWALSQGRVHMSSGAVRDQDGELWAMIVSRRALTSEESGEHVYSDTMPLRRQTRFGRRERRDAAIPPVFLQVRDLGDIQVPDDDRGLVGSVEIGSELSPQNIRVGEGAILTVTIRGPQVEQLTTYPPPDVPGLRFYPIDGRSGRSDAPQERTFRWQVIPQYHGTFDIRAHSLPWLDPEALRYRRAQASSHRLQVAPGGRMLEVADRILIEEGDQLPEPLRLAPVWAPSLAQLWLLLFCGLLAGLGLRGLWFARGLHWGGHRGRRLARAWRQGDWATVTTLSHHLLPQLSDEDTRSRAAAAVRALERHRFGHEPLDQQAVHRDLECLERLP